MPTKHEKFMRDVFGRPASETRKAQAQISQELSDQGQQTSPAIQGTFLHGQGPSRPPTGGPGPTVKLTDADIIQFEEQVISLRDAAKNLLRVRTDWPFAGRDYLGTLWTNVSSLANRLVELEASLKAHLDATRNDKR